VRDLSAKAYGILMAIVQHNINISAESLAEHFNEGRRSMLSGLKELRDNDYLVTKNQRVGNRIIKMSTITEKAERLFFGVNSQVVKSQNSTSVTRNEHIKQNKTYSTVISNKNSLTESKIKFGDEEFEVMNMSSWDGLFAPTSEGDDWELDKKEAKEQVKQKNLDAKKERAKKRSTHRSGRDTATWSVFDVCFEFSDRINDAWGVAPWEVTQSKFSGAMTQTRNRLGTTGDVEIAAMDIFFKQITISEYKDGEVLWRLFIARLPGLVGQARMSLRSEDTDKVAEDAFEIGMRKLRGENV
jgi:hypothetical protein